MKLNEFELGLLQLRDLNLVPDAFCLGRLAESMLLRYGLQNVRRFPTMPTVLNSVEASAIDHYSGEDRELERNLIRAPGQDSGVDVSILVSNRPSFRILLYRKDANNTSDTLYFARNDRQVVLPFDELVKEMYERINEALWFFSTETRVKSQKK